MNKAPRLLQRATINVLKCVLCITLVSCKSKKEGHYADKKNRPNIVIFYVDDLGYGDVGIHGAVGVKTPVVDELARQGVTFTDAHSSASTCTPSRYSLLTGRYAFRNNAAILPGDAPLLIKPGSYTLPSMLKKAGYATAVVGKWHLGLGNGNVNWNGDVKPGPLEIGFDYSFLLPSTGDRVPSVYLENHRVVNADGSDPIVVDYDNKLDGYPNGIDNPELLRQKADYQHSNTIVNGVSRIGYMSGGKKALWVDEDFPNILTSKANTFIEENQEKPFFLFFSFHDIHVPRLPAPQFKGKSTMGPRGDAIAEMDWITGQVLEKLDKLGLAENTLVIFTSDNGPVLNDGYEDGAVELLGSHRPWGDFRGGKYSIYEAGTRVPTIVRWPGKVRKGVSNALLSQVDLYASVASILHIPLAADEAIDSKDMSKVLTGNDPVGRNYLLEEGYALAMRKGDWKFIEPIQKARKIPEFMKNKGIESGVAHVPQLYQLTNDKAEQKDLSRQRPDLVRELQAKLDEVKKQTKRVEAND